MKRDQVAERDAKLIEAAQQYYPRGKLSVVCGAIVEQGEPTGAINLQVRRDEIHALALAIKAKREGR